MAFDVHKNFAISTVVTAPSPATSGTSLTIASGDGAKFPTSPFNAVVFPANTAFPTILNAEIVRVVDNTDDVFTIMRSQESTTAQPIAAGFIIYESPTVKTFTDIENAISSGGVTSFTFTNANGFSGSVTNPDSTPDLTLSVDGTHYLPTTTDESYWNAKQSALSFGNLTEATSNILTITGGSGAVIGMGTSIAVTKADSTHSGYLSSTDWGTFNSKQSSLSFGNVSESTSDVLTFSGNTNAVIGSGLTIQVKKSSALQDGYLSSTDWSTFNGKQSSLTLGNLTETTSSILTITGGSDAIIGSGLTIAVTKADSTHNGYLSDTDWGTFNGKQGTITLTTTGSSGAATFIGNTLNIPQYSGGSGSVTAFSFTNANGFSGTVTNSTSTPDLTMNVDATHYLPTTTDESNWNGKQNALSLGNLTETGSSILTITGGTGATVGNVTIQVSNASASTNGYLSDTDWNTFNDKQSALSISTLSETGSSVLTITGGSGAVIGTGTTIDVTKADVSHSGYLSSTDFGTFSGKQDSLGFTPENVANKSTNTSLGTSDTDYPTQNAVKTYVDTTESNITFNSLSPMTTIGDTIYESGSSVASRLAGNTSTVQKFLSQTGDGTVSAAPSWQTTPTAGLLTYYLTPTASSITNYLQMTAAPYTPKTTLTYSGVNSTQVLKNFSTNAGIPNLTFIPAGQFEFHIHASSTSPSGVNVYAEFWEVSSTGTDIGLIGTSESTDVDGGLTTSEEEFRLYFTTANVYTMASSASRLVCRVWANRTSGTHTISLYVGDEADSHIALPSNTVDATNFIPYVGATTNIDIGSHNFQTEGNVKLMAGTLTMAPLTFPVGTNLTTPVSGSVEFDGNYLYFTDNSGTPVRRQLVSLDQSETLTNKTIAGASNTITLTFSNVTTGLGYTPLNKAGGTMTGTLVLDTGTTTVAPMTIPDGSLLTSLSNGAIEHSGNHLYITLVSTRYQLDQQTGGVSMSGSSTPSLSVTGTSSISGSNTGDQTITLTGDVTGTGTGSFAATIGNGKVTPSKLATGAASAYVAAFESTTTQNSWLDLATTTDQVTVTVGANGLLLVGIAADMYGSTAGTYTSMGFALSGANTMAPVNGQYAMFTHGNIDNEWGATFLVTGLSAGSTTVKAKYELGGGGSQTGNWGERTIWAIPL